MTNNIKEAIEYIDSLQIDRWNGVYYADCMRKISSILQEANDGKEVDLHTSGVSSHGYQSYNCPNSKCNMTVAKSLDGDEFSENYCPYCGQKLIWPEQQEEPKEEAFDVVEYEWSQDNGCTTVCPHSTSIDELKPRIGSAHCKQYCPHFKGHYEEGKYIRCSAKKDGV